MTGWTHKETSFLRTSDVNALIDIVSVLDLGAFIFIVLDNDGILLTHNVANTFALYSCCDWNTIDIMHY